VGAVRNKGESYPLHHGDYYLAFVLGMWHHTRELRGVPTEHEIRLTLPDWPRARFKELLAMLARHGLVQAPAAPLPGVP
jgi:peptidoglycan/xylan/chitin deacetylase (PgdA/CDA1 family)